PARYPLSLHDALPIYGGGAAIACLNKQWGAAAEGAFLNVHAGVEQALDGGCPAELGGPGEGGIAEARAGAGVGSGAEEGRDPARSEEHTSELQSPDHL